MQCEEFEARLHELLDLGLRPEADGALERHAASCPGCYRLLAGQELLIEGLELGLVPPLSEDFASRVIAELPTVRRSWPAQRATLAFVAALTAAVLIGVFPWIRDFWTEATPANVVEAVPEGAPTNTSISPNELVQSPESVRADERPTDVAVVDEQPFAWELEQWATRIPTMEDLPAVNSFLGGAEASQAETPRWMTPVAGGLRPVANSMVGALNVIRGTLPGLRSERPRDPQAGGPALRPLSWVV